MDRTDKIKKRLTWAIIIFLSLMAVFVVISRTIYDYLLPVAEVQRANSGRVENKRIMDGKIGLDESTLKRKKVTLTSPIEGITADFKVEEGSEVKSGDELFTTQKDEDNTEVLSAKLDTEELILKEQGLLRKIQDNQEKRQKLEETYKKKKEELQKSDTSSGLLDIKQQIDEQSQIVAANEALHDEGLIEEVTYKKEKEKLELMKKKKEELIKSKAEGTEDDIKDLQDKIHTSILEEANLKDELKLNQKKAELKQTSDNKKVAKSPINGYIYTLSVGEGTRVEKGEDLVVIIPKGIPCYLNFEVSNEETEGIEVGQEVNFTLNQMPKKAKIVKKNFNEATGNLVMTAKVEKEVLEKLKLDYKTYKNVKVEIVNSFGPYNLIVSNSAVRTEYGRSYIYIIEEKSGAWGKVYKAQKVDVRVLQEGDYNCAIEGAITKDSQIIKYPLDSMEDGEEVALKLGEGQ